MNGATLDRIADLRDKLRETQRMTSTVLDLLQDEIKAAVAGVGDEPLARYLSLREVAELLSITEQCARTWAVKGNIPAQRFQGSIRVKASALQALLDQAPLAGEQIPARPRARRERSQR